MNLTKTFGLSIKQSIKIRSIILLLLLNFMFLQISFSQVRLPKLVSNGMILQRETPVTIWGWASAGEQVTVNFNNSKISTVTATDGKWEITLSAQNAGGPFQMTITCNNEVILKDFYFGDVWLCSGQSNMEYPMSRLTDRYY